LEGDWTKKFRVAYSLGRHVGQQTLIQIVDSDSLNRADQGSAIPDYGRKWNREIDE